VNGVRDEEIDVAVVGFLGHLSGYDYVREDLAQCRRGLQFDGGVD
jgi:hypothetical protein